MTGGCASVKSKGVDFSDQRKTFEPDDYGRVFDTWTRSGSVIQDLGTVIEIWATYKSWEFRQAFLEKYNAVYGPPEGDRAAMFESQRAAANDVYEFHVVVETTDYRWNDLDKRNSPWRVTLVDGTGAELPASSIDVQKLPLMYESQFFPKRTEFSRTYVFRFEKTRDEETAFVGAQSGRLVLRVAGPMARVDLVWRSAR